MKIASLLIGAFLVVFVAKFAYDYKIESLKTAHNSETSDITADVRAKQLECLAQNIYYEAGSEPFEGKAAVAQVTLNRAESGKFPKDICKVVYQKNIVYDKVLCQFSWYCEGKGGVRPTNHVAYRQSMDAAKQVLLEGFRLPSLKNAMYYHADYVNPKWNKEKVVIIQKEINYEIRYCTNFERRKR
jgi:spore germination cell wall hydrolase CwlJ-like protein